MKAKTQASIKVSSENSSSVSSKRPFTLTNSKMKTPDDDLAIWKKLYAATNYSESTVSKYQSIKDVLKFRP